MSITSNVPDELPDEEVETIDRILRNRAYHIASCYGLLNAVEDIVQESWRIYLQVRRQGFPPAMACRRALLEMPRWNPSVLVGSAYRRRAHDRFRGMPIAVEQALWERLHRVDASSIEQPLMVAQWEQILRKALTEFEYQFVQARLLGYTLKELGESMGVTESRACQIAARIKQKVRDFLSTQHTTTEEL